MAEVVGEVKSDQEWTQTSSIHKITSTAQLMAAQLHDVLKHTMLQGFLFCF